MLISVSILLLLLLLLLLGLSRRGGKGKSIPKQGLFIALPETIAKPSRPGHTRKGDRPMKLLPPVTPAEGVS